jgi:hypothetical protein
MTKHNRIATLALWWLYFRWSWYAPIPLRNPILRARGKQLI